MADIDDIIFNNRNRSYGAYSLRKKNPVILIISVMISVTLFSAVFVSLLIYYNMQGQPGEDRSYIYDDSGIGNPYQPNLILSKKPERSKKTEQKKEVHVTDAIIPNDTLKNETSGGSIDTSGRGKTTAGGVDTINGGSDTSRLDGFKMNNAAATNNKLVTRLDKPPMFPGGEGARIIFLQKNILYPDFAKKNKIQGPVFVTFFVEKDGSITNIQVLQGIGVGCDQEAMRVVRTMPKWLPGVKNRTPVRVMVTMPIIFTLQSSS